MPRNRSNQQVTISRAVFEDLRQFLLALSDQPTAIRATEQALDCGDFFSHLLTQLNSAARDATVRVVDGVTLYAVNYHGERRWVSVPRRDELREQCESVQENRSLRLSRRMATRATAAAPRLGYYHLARAWYAASSIRSGLNEPVDEVMFGKYYVDGSGAWEAAMRFFALRNGREPAARLEIFDDGFVALAELPMLFAELAHVPDGTLRPAGFCELLERHGFVDLTPETAPTAIREASVHSRRSR